MLITLPQFKPGVACADGRVPNACCAACRKSGDEFDAWRLAHAGVARFDCPHGVQAPAKPRRAAPEEIERRVGLPCPRRTADGLCPICPTCRGNPRCADVAAWKDCPGGLWKNNT